MKLSSAICAVLAAVILSSCSTTSAGGGTSSSASRATLAASIAQEPRGQYVGRRYYKKDYKFWGYVRQSGMPWSTARMVMMNEHTKLAPDREQGAIGTDNNYEYRLIGEFTGQTVYEPASNGFYPEFRLRGHQLISTTPAPIFREAGATNPERRIIAKPY